MFRNKWVWLAIGVVGGMIVAPKLRQLPLLNRVPSVG